jgi:acyl carrier protein phosphodiesterase
MNHLVHAFVSPWTGDVLTGSVAGDFVKGRLDGRFSSDLTRGLALHRKLDAFADSHLSRQSVIRCIGPEFSRYAGVMFDVVGDYYLATEWGTHSSKPLREFVDELYQVLGDSGRELPSEFHLMVSRMIASDWLGRSDSWLAVERTLAFLGTRFRRPNPLHRAATELQRHEAVLRPLFHHLLGDLVLHARILEADAAPFWIQAR